MEYGRTLKLIWGGDAHQAPQEFILEVREADQRKSKRTNDANFEVTIFREKNGQWVEIGYFTEHVSGDDERNELFAIPDSQDSSFILLCRSDNHPIIRRFRKEEW